MNKVYPIYEIMGSFLSHSLKVDGQNMESLRDNPKDFLKSQFNVESVEVDINIVNNEENEINIALPYYSGIETQNAKRIDGEEDLSSIHGGEIFIALSAIICVGTVGGAAAITGAVVHAAYAEDTGK